MGEMYLFSWRHDVFGWPYGIYRSLDKELTYELIGSLGTSDGVLSLIASGDHIYAVANNRWFCQRYIFDAYALINIFVRFRQKLILGSFKTSDGTIFFGYIWGR
jgi:hypothetical protein